MPFVMLYQPAGLTSSFHYWQSFL